MAQQSRGVLEQGAPFDRFFEEQNMRWTVGKIRQASRAAIPIVLAVARVAFLLLLLLVAVTLVRFFALVDFLVLFPKLNSLSSSHPTAVTVLAAIVCAGLFLVAVLAMFLALQVVRFKTRSNPATRTLTWRKLW